MPDLYNAPLYDGLPDIPGDEPALEPHHRAARERTPEEQAALDAIAWEHFGALNEATIRRNPPTPDAIRRFAERHTAASFRLSGLIP